MTEKVFYVKDGSIIVFNPNEFNIIIKMESDNTFTIILNGYEKHYTKYAKLEQVFRELLELKFEFLNIDKDKIRYIWG